ncbi:MAG: DNA mismatch repair protein MutT [Candidatus Niyogibacteria bacterium CG10_big_fil_rev_8_21_14_0_10_46_36]|uniref:DNA mismatch repair protein MutT n=1 Tax=Candidatus Niyogibacteria bacterium CG10_big_fil_rev_8_21_14_0_10_46_36 TaxID=1974726 RepID=A0A2H0TEC8_9BACT|nr:MAG: DNA mismatch repair protein MutT [Candidatus Niyogibacteria bacterium CG10_big_fil_rev_8_21_14_0_10_46_36]
MQRGPYTGIGVMIFKSDLILLGKRKGSHGAGEWAFPGGLVELGESWEDAVSRELKEETGDALRIGHLCYFCLAHEAHYVHEDPTKQYTHLGYVADWEGGEPCVMEPEKCEAWSWFPVDELPSPMFSMTKYMLMSYIRGVPYADIAKAKRITKEFNQEEVAAYFQKKFFEQSKKRYD